MQQGSPKLMQHLWGCMSESETQFKVVGIGASGVDLYAVKAILMALPPVTGSAFLLVSHSDPAHDHMSVELLSGDTSLNVVMPVDGMRLEAEHLYVGPPGFCMRVEQGAIRLIEIGNRHDPGLPFDCLLHSISREFGPLAIAVVASARDADGTQGSKSVENAGGLVIMQNPRETDFDSMPQSAVDHSVHPKVLSAAVIARKIIDHDPPPAIDRIDLSENDGAEIVENIIQLLNDGGPNDFLPYKRATLQACVEKRLVMLDIPKREIERYVALLRQSVEERRKLTNDLFACISGFFRDPKLFDFVRDVAIPDIFEHVKGDTVRVWVAGCGTGEEAYSLAALFLDHIETRGLGVKLQVFASDADAEVLAVAREGRYSMAAVEPVPRRLLETYFTRDADGYSVHPRLRGSVVFTVQNVLTNPPFARMDMISCRNLLKYLRPEAQAKALALFSFSIREGGILLIGKAETVGRLDDRFKLISMSQRVYRRVGHHVPGEYSFNLTVGGNRATDAARGARAPSRQTRLEDLVSQALLRKHVPAAILVDRKYEYLYSAGPAWEILHIPAGLASLDLFAITPRPLHAKIRSAIAGATQSGKPFAVNGAKVESNGSRQQFSIHAELLSSHGEEFYLICFPKEMPLLGETLRDEGSGADATRVLELETELEDMRVQLQVAHHNLEIADEEHKVTASEALSLSEEYQAANEELIASGQELRSQNDDLTALNKQLHSAAERQRAVSSDLENLLYSTEVPTLFLDEALHIRFFTPATRLLFNIIPSDVGRPLSDLTMLADDATLQADALAVIGTTEKVEKEIFAHNAHWYIRKIKPYKTAQGNTDGVVITFIDISAQKRIVEDHEAAKKSAELATEAKSHFLAAASHDLRQPLQTLKLLHGLLDETIQSAQARLFVKRMEDTLASMSGILKTILDINQVEVGMVQPKPESFYIADILERLRKEFSFLALGKGLELKVITCGIAVHTDPQLLEQILRNLLSNALKYTQTGKVLVGCRNRGRKLRLEIWDTGIGIPENEIGDIFNAYHRLDVTSGDPGQGLGLGLSIVKRLSDLLELNVSACSQPGKGSSFSIEIGRAVIGQPLVALPVALTPNRRRSKDAATILVIEDEEAMRDLLRIGLEHAGYVVTATTSAVEALDIIRGGTFVPEIILADYDLGPGMDGLAVIGEVRRMLAHRVPALVLTGNVSSHALRKYGQHRVPHLNKPAKLRDIVDAIDDLLAYRQVHSPVLDIREEPDEAADLLIDIIDDDPGVREGLRDLFKGTGWSAQTYRSGEEYLERYRADRASCVLLDAYLPGMGGLDLLRILRERGHRFPVIIITGHSDVQMAVEAMKQGAVDFIEKPFSTEEIHASVQKAFDLFRDRGQRSERREEAQAVLARLTHRQRQILERIVAGQPNKIIAAEMEISQRTVENHRASIMRRTASTSFPALLRLVVAAEE